MKHFLKNDIAFDLDGTLVDLMGVFEKVLMEKHRAQVNPVRGWQITTNPPLSDNDIWYCFGQAYTMIDDFPIYPGAAELLTSLYEKTGDPPMIVTQRPAWSATYTHELARRFLSVPYTVAFVERAEDKMAYLGGCQYYVDDRRKVALSIAESGRHAFLLDRPYNQIDFNQYPKLFSNITIIQDIRDLFQWTNNFIKEVRYFDVIDSTRTFQGEGYRCSNDERR